MGLVPRLSHRALSKTKRLATSWCRTIFRKAWALSHPEAFPVSAFEPAQSASGVFLNDFLPLPPARKLVSWLSTYQRDKAQQPKILTILVDRADLLEAAADDISESVTGLKDLFLIIILRTSDLPSPNSIKIPDRLKSLNVLFQPFSTDEQLRDLMSVTTALIDLSSSLLDQCMADKISACGVPIADSTTVRHHLTASSDRHAEYRRVARASAYSPQRLQELKQLPWVRDIETARATPKSSVRNVLVASHDTKFANMVIEELRAMGHQVAIDTWSGHNVHDVAESKRLLEWADVIWCEWGLGNIVWYSKRKKSHQRLITRIHAQEARTDYLSEVNWSKVDAVVFVAEHIRRTCIRDFDIPGHLCTVIPNVIVSGSPDTLMGSPSSSEHRRFNIGLVGFVPSSKGLMEAIEVIRLLHTQDCRYQLFLRGKCPDQYPWINERPDEEEYYAKARAQIAELESLKDAISYSPFGSDMPAFYEQMGFVISTSRHEAFHFTIPDGATNGAVPVLFRWPGSDLLYPSEWTVSHAGEMAERILSLNESAQSWHEIRSSAKAFVDERYSHNVVLPSLINTVLGS
ncbi:glycosyltransferase family 4 protein [Auritidibacter ignavus]|uniref:glycosyltransferase family 4 protein n=1 Tax=Auritidibacter ignavus TaxID=678932 RepID=UPI0010A3F69B|nr:glycosyltransferase family 4 protein [Auritidibacter ignavus]WHS35096.1 glycosyltransferase family 4 protein [Auritidibacter ignavus]